MAALRLIDALPDFGAPPAAARPEIARPLPHAAQAPAAPPAIDVEAVARARVAVAEEALRLTLTRQHEAELAAERDRHAAALDAQARTLGTEAGAAIAARLAVLERNVTDHVAAGAARILGAALSEDLLKRSIAGLAATIAEALRDNDALRIEVRGPASMFTGLSETLGEHAAAIHFIEAGGLDLSATVDGTVFETRLSEWSSLLSGILE